MNDFIQQFTQQLIATSLFEWLAVVLAIAYLLLAIKESLWCWPAAFASTAIYMYLFFDASLYMESFLNFYYLIMAIYGFYQWQDKHHISNYREIVKWPNRVHFIGMFICLILVFISYILLEKYTDQDFAFLDSFTTWFAIFATYLLTQKVLEHWLYWVVIDIVSIYIFVEKGFALTSVLFLIYTVLAIKGWFNWKQSYYRGSSYAT